MEIGCDISRTSFIVKGGGGAEGFFKKIHLAFMFLWRQPFWLIIIYVWYSHVSIDCAVYLNQR